MFAQRLLVPIVHKKTDTRYIRRILLTDKRYIRCKLLTDTKYIRCKDCKKWILSLTKAIKFSSGN